MTTTADPSPSPPTERELVLTRETSVSAEKLFAGWTTPELLMQWFTPPPWMTTACRIDLRPGGEFQTTMRGPDGQEFPNTGVFLEVVPDRKLVFTDAYAPGWIPNPDPFFTAIITFETLPDGGTRYTAKALHWTPEACQKHAAMGFMEGWGKAFDQLVGLSR